MREDRTAAVNIIEDMLCSMDAAGDRAEIRKSAYDNLESYMSGLRVGSENHWREIATLLADRLRALEYTFGCDMPTTAPTCRSVEKALKAFDSANVSDDQSLLASGMSPAREAELAGDMPEVPKGRGFGRSVR